MKKNYMNTGNYQPCNENSTIEELLHEANQLFADMINTTKRILNLLSPAKKRQSCLRPMACRDVFFPLSYDKNACYGMKGTHEFGIRYCIWGQYLHSSGEIRRYFEDCRKSNSDEVIEKAIRHMLLITD